MKNGLITAFCALFLLSCTTEREIVPETDYFSDITLLESYLEMINQSPDYVFDVESLPQILIQVSTSEWNRLLKTFDRYPFSETDVRASFTWSKNGFEEYLPQAALRFTDTITGPEGNRRGHHDPDNPQFERTSYRVDFNLYADEYQFHDLEAIYLNAMTDEASGVRNAIGYDLLRWFGVPYVPRVSYAEVKLFVMSDETPTDLGVYEIVEPVDREFLRNHFPGNDDGYLWNCDNSAVLLTNDTGYDMGVEIPQRSVFYTFDLKTNERNLDSNAIPQFIGFISNLNYLTGDEFETWISNSFDVDHFLQILAVNALLGMNELASDYYLYFGETNGTAYYIPVDYSECLADASVSDLFYSAQSGSNPLIGKILSVDKYYSQYSNYLTELVTSTNEIYSGRFVYQRLSVIPDDYDTTAVASVTNILLRRRNAVIPELGLEE